MSSDTANAATGTLFFILFMVTVYPLMRYYGGIPPADIFIKALGLTYGEVVICALIIGIVFVWSTAQVFFLILDVITMFVFSIYENERIRNFAEVMGGRANRTIGRKFRMWVRDIQREMKDKESL